MSPITASSRCVVCNAVLAEACCQACGAASSPGGFKVERLISKSPRGRLYAARAPDDTRVALKELVFASVPSTLEIEAFEREARTLVQLSHPRIPRLVRFFKEGEGAQLRLYLAQTFIEGESLLELLEKRRWSEAQVLGLAEQVLDILVYLQDLSPRVLHRDLKPANLILRGEEVFLVDFDCARDVVQGQTHQHTLVGTFGYCPPEQLGGTVDASSDLYALGATLLHVLTRRSPAELVGPDLRLKLDAMPQSVSPALAAFVGKLCELDRRARFGSAREAQQALRELRSAKAAGLEAKAQQGSDAETRPTSRDGGSASTSRSLRRAGVIVAGLVGTASAALGVFALRAPVLVETEVRPLVTNGVGAGPIQPHAGAGGGEGTRGSLPLVTSVGAPVTGRLDGDRTPALALDHAFVHDGLAIEPVRFERVEEQGRLLTPGWQSRVVLRLSDRTVMGRPEFASMVRRRFWTVVGKEWSKLARLLISRPDCPRCESVLAYAVRVHRPDGTVYEGQATDDLGRLTFELGNQAPTEVLIELLFKIETSQLPISVLFSDGHLVQVPW